MKHINQHLFSRYALMGVMMVASVMMATVSAEESGLVDPTRPPPEVMQMLELPDANVQPVLTLSALKESGKDSFAIINNTVVRLGEVFQGYTLIKVSGTQAVLVDAGKNKTTLALEMVDYRRPVRSDLAKPAKKRKHNSSH